MFRTTLANLRAHRARLLLSSLAIVLGVAFVAGTFVFTDAIKKAFLDGFAEDVGQADVVVTAQGEAPVSTEVLTTVRGVQGVAHVAGRITGATAELRDAEGEPVPGSTGTAIVSVPRAADLRWQDVTEGRLPDARGEAVLDLGTAEHTALGVGEEVRVAAPGESGRPGQEVAAPDMRALDIVGLVDLGNSPQYAGRPFVGTTVEDAAALTGEDRFNMVLATGDGASAGQLAERVQAAVGPSHTVRTGEEQARHAADELSGATTAVRLALLAFAGIALFVAAIVIANTFAILLAQRTRELALLRCVGATRRQIFRSVLLESAALGLTGSAVGVAAGYGLATGIGAILDAALETFPFAPARPSAVAVIVPLAIGLLVTVAAAVFPARGATRIPPVAALREGAQNQPRPGRLRLTAAALGVCGGGAGLAVGSIAPHPAFELPALGFVIAFIGGLAAFSGILLAGPVVIPPAIRAAGALLGRSLGTAGRLAAANTMRNPRRAAATTSALLVGATLMSLMLVGAASVQRAATSQLDQQFPVDYAVQADSGDGIPGGLVATIHGIDGLADTAALRHAETRLGTEPGHVAGVNPQALGAVTDAFPALRNLADGQAVLVESAAERLSVGEGDAVRLGEDGSSQELTVGAVVPGLNMIGAEAVITKRQFGDLFAGGRVGSVLAKLAGGADAEEVGAALDRAVAHAPGIDVTGAAETKQNFTRTLDAMLLVVAALLGVAVLIALVGIANTLSLSVIERTRESGLLRALGLTRGQLRGTLAAEAALIGLTGGLLGAGLGIVFGWAGAASLLPVDDVALVVPAGRLAALLAVAVAAALLASVFPGRRAARTSVVSALADE